jgi:hypothetical protein
MESLRIDIINPKAKKIIKELADLKLISITEESGKSLQRLLKKLRSTRPSMSIDEITAEVEVTRAKRHAKKG